MNRVISCYNQYHLGDCIEALHFLINAARCNDVKFNFLCNRDYHSQLKEFIGDANVKLYSIAPPDIDNNTFINTWIGAYDYGGLCRISDEMYGSESDQATFFLLLAEVLSKIMEIKCPFTEKADLMYNESVLNQLCSHDKTYDYLFINSQNMSIPFPNFEKESSTLLRKMLDAGKSVITTRKVEGVPCTIDFNLSIVEIARLANNVNNIVAVNTGPLHLCMNKWIIPNIDNFIIWSPAETFNYGSNFRTVRSLEELYENYIF